MTNSRWSSPAGLYGWLNRLAERHADLGAIVLVCLGLLHRLYAAQITYFSPEEASHVLLAVGRDFSAPLHHDIIGSHPPLFLFSVRLTEFSQNSILAMRLPFVLAAAAAPLIVYAWLKRYHGVAAAWISLFILLMAPNIFVLGWQVRGYVFALAGMATAIYGMDRALEHRSIAWLPVSFGGLYVSLLAEYMSVWFLAGIGTYSLIEVLRNNPGRRFRIAWAAGQAGAVGILAWLKWLKFGDIGLAEAKAVNWKPFYLADHYLVSGENPLQFFAEETLGVFEYLFATKAAGAIVLGLFLVGVFRLCTGKMFDSYRARTLPVLIVLPLLLTAAAAMLHVYPYGGTRHSIHLAIGIAIGVGIGLEPLFRRRMAVLLVILGALTPLWYLYGVTEPSAVTYGFLKRQWVEEAFDYLRENVPPGAIILTDDESRPMLSYYLDPDTPYPRGLSGLEEHVGGYILYSPGWSFWRYSNIEEAMARLREHYGIAGGQPVWGLDTGFVCAMCQAIQSHPELVDNAVSVKQFGLGAAVFRMPRKRGDAIPDSTGD